MKKFFLFLITIMCLNTIVVLSQKVEKKKGVYSAHLCSVEVSKEIKQINLDTVLSIYEDSIIKIKWDYNPTQIDFNLTNNSDQSIKIKWDDAAFISLNNESSKIFHKGIKYIDRENPQPPTVIYKKTILSDLIAPTSYVYYTSGQYGGWNSSPLIPVKGSIWSSKIDYLPELIGKTMRVVLPIIIDEKTIEYTFYFRTEFIEKTN